MLGIAYLFSLVVAFMLSLVAWVRAEPVYKLVINGDRAIDPETGLDGIRNVGITGDRIVAVTEAALAGEAVIHPAVGFHWVLVNGQPVVHHSELVLGAPACRPIRRTPN